MELRKLEDLESAFGGEVADVLIEPIRPDWQEAEFYAPVKRETPTPGGDVERRLEESEVNGG